jgi:hypothetical protein
LGKGYLKLWLNYMRSRGISIVFPRRIQDAILQTGNRRRNRNGKEPQEEKSKLDI